MNAVTLIQVNQYFEKKIEEKRFPKTGKGDREPNPGWHCYTSKHTDTEWVFVRTEEQVDKPYYVATLTSMVDAQRMSYNSEQRYGGTFIGPKAETPRQAVMALLDAMALAQSAATK